MPRDEAPCPKNSVGIPYRSRMCVYINGMGEQEKEETVSKERGISRFGRRWAHRSAAGAHE